MSDSHEHYDGAYAAGEMYEPDVGPRPTATIFAYIFVLSAVFFVTLGALYVYFKWEADMEKSRKVWTVESSELKELRAEEDKALTDVSSAMKAVAAENK
jgi:hypothetical protein